MASIEELTPGRLILADGVALRVVRLSPPNAVFATLPGVSTVGKLFAACDVRVLTDDEIASLGLKG